MSRIVEINTTGVNHVGRFTKQLLMDYSVPEPNTGCWLWTGSFFRCGYGSLWDGSKNRLAHRVAWMLFRGSIPDDLCVCHKCDTPACVNPDHLFVGTYADNAHDRDAKGRQAKGDRNGSRLYPERLARGDQNFSRQHPEKFRGENNGRAKLSIDAVKTIRLQYANGVQQKDLAARYGTDQTTISNIVVRKTWRHVV